jgi:8-hydroxy-5-deazaflavin:NADPH oxidoreductase
MRHMKIAILGTGDVGQALGHGFLRLGHEVKMGSRQAGGEKAQAWVAKMGKGASEGSFAEAAAFGDLAVLATLWTGTENALRMAGPENLAGKIVIDSTNPLLFSPGKPPALALGHTDSGGEQVQRWLPESRVVKCFNIVGHAHMVHPDLPGGPPDMFLCGNESEAKTTVARICRDFGWPVIDIGGIEGARLLEPICILWVLYGIRTNSWNHAFKLLRE